MRIGLVGAQGTGKTTLAEAVSNETDLPLIFTQTANVFKRAGLRPDTALSFQDRMKIQHLVLDDALEIWSDEFMFVTDRTPIDMLAYAMIDINSDTRLTTSEVRQFHDYRNRCYQITNDLFTTLVLVQPGIKVVDQTKPRASLDPVLCETFNSILLGLMVNNKIKTYCSFIPEDVLSLDRRVRAVLYSLHRSANELVKGLDTSIVH